MAEYDKAALAGAIEKSRETIERLEDANGFLRLSGAWTFADFFRKARPGVGQLSGRCVRLAQDAVVELHEQIKLLPGFERALPQPGFAETFSNALVSDVFARGRIKGARNAVRLYIRRVNEVLGYLERAERGEEIKPLF